MGYGKNATHTFLRLCSDAGRSLVYVRAVKMRSASVPRLLIQVINLASRPDRLELIGSRLKNAGLDFETQVAVDGKKAGFESKFLSRGEIGAFKSHVNAMRRQNETGAEYSLILEDDAALNRVVDDRFLTKMMELMDRNKIDILQIGFIEHLYSFSLRSGVLESIINLLNWRGRKDPSGFRYVIGEFRSGAHAYIVSSHLAEGISSAVSEPPLLPWDDWLGLMAKAQTHRNFRIARLVKSVVSQASRSSQNSKIDSDIEGPES